MNIQDFIKDSMNNKHKIFPDTVVSCYHCKRVYLGKEIKEYTADNSAICNCWVDSVVPYEVDPETLEKASRYYFSALYGMEK